MCIGACILVAAASGLIIQTGAADALCPDLATTKQAVLARVGTIRLLDQTAYRLRYTVGHTGGEPHRDFVHVDLFDPDGKRVLSRDLPIEKGNCQLTARTIALVVERYFRALTGESDASQTETSDGSVAAARRPKTASPSGFVRPPTSVRRKPAPPAANREPAKEEPAEPEAATALGAWSGWDPSAGLLVGLDLRVKVTSTIGLVALPAVAGAERHQRISGADVWARAFPLRLGVMFGSGLGDLGIRAGPELLALIESARAEGLENSHDRWRTALGLGVQAALVYPLTSRWSLALQGAIDWLPRPLVRDLEVSGRRVLEVPPVGGFVGVGVAFGSP